jgi:hypothetical protein
MRLPPAGGGGGGNPTTTYRRIYRERRHSSIMTLSNRNQGSQSIRRSTPQFANFDEPLYQTYTLDRFFYQLDALEVPVHLAVGIV